MNYVEFDEEKDRANTAKHGISLARTSDFEPLLILVDDRLDYGEARYRAWGTIDGRYHALAFMLRSGRLRAISLRRAHAREIDRLWRSRQP